MSTKALPELTIPRGPDEVTSEWLTSALRRQGVLGNERVSATSHEILGVGEGFVGTIARFRLEYETLPASAPTTLIAKFPIVIEQNKNLAEQIGAYEREIRFYQELRSSVPIKTPELYYADMDRNPFEGREERFADAMDRWPNWLIRLVLPLVQWLATKQNRRYVLLLEDLAPAPVGDQVAGCGPREAEAALRALARVHAAFWDRMGPELSWLPRIDWLKRWAHVLYLKGWRAFPERYPGLPRLIELAEWFEDHGIAMVDQFAAMPKTLMHGDYRLDNMTLVEEPDGSVVITAFDWQGPTRGPGVIDVAYFISGNLPSEVAAAHEDSLFDAYYQELCARGVTGYGAAQARDDYELAKLWTAYRFIVGVDMLDLGDDRGLALFDSWLTRLEALIPPDYARRLHPIDIR